MLITEAKNNDRVVEMYYSTKYIPNSGQYKVLAVPKDTEAMLGDDQLLVPAESIVTLGPTEDIVIPDGAARIVYFSLKSIRCPVPIDIVREHLFDHPIPINLIDEEQDMILSLISFYRRDLYPYAIVPVQPCLYDMISSSITTIGCMLIDQPHYKWSCKARACLGEILVTIRDRQLPATLVNTALQRALDYIHASLSEAPTVAQISDIVGMSPNDLSRALVSFTGQSTQAYIDRCRLKRADYKLRTTDLSIDSIAAESGYPSVKAMEQSVKRAHGMTPSAYRDKGPIDRNTRWPGWMQRPVDL